MDSEGKVDVVRKNEKNSICEFYIFMYCAKKKMIIIIKLKN